MSARKPKVDRSTKYTNKLAEIICEKIMEGYSLRSICLADDMPCKATIFRWLDSKPEFVERYTVAREIQADTLFDEILDIADDGSNDTYTDKDGNEKTNHEVVQRSRLRIDTRKWMAGKLRPKKYGEKIFNEVTGEDGAPLVPVLHVTIAKPVKPDEAAA